ncbi:GroES-like protein [Trametes polyzona]|nr:GroES-like protein [Trametes polyzona]
MSTPATQKALLLPSKEAAYIVGERLIPPIGPTEILVKNVAVGLNPVEWKFASPVLSSEVPSYPFTPGLDGSGVVAAVGQDVTDFKVGDRVVYQGFMFDSLRTTFQEYTIVASFSVAKLPESVSFEAAATISGTFPTVILGLFNSNHPEQSLGLKPFWEEGGSTAYAGKQFFILGGATSVGQYAIQVAKASGFGPIIATASPRNTELLTSLGATHVIDRSLSDEAVLAELSRLTQGAPIEIAFDTVALPNTQALAYKALAPNGRLLLVLPEQIPAELKKDGDGRRAVFVQGLVHPPLNEKVGGELYRRLPEWLEKGVIKPNDYEVLPLGLAGIPEGLERLRNNQVSAKKLVVRVGETP